MFAADEPVSLVEQLRFQRRRVPDTIGNEMVQLIVVARGNALRHRLNTFAVARTDQSRNVQGTHPPPGLMTQPIQERFRSSSSSHSAMVSPPRANHP